MKKLAGLLTIVLLAAIIQGCGSSDSASSDAPPKGEAPNVVKAPPGAKNPEERGMEAQGRAAGDQDGGGQDGK